MLLKRIIFRSTSFSSTILHRTVQCVTRTVPYAVLCRYIGVGFLALYLVRHRPSLSGDGYPILVATSRRAYIILFHLLFLYREGSSSLGSILDVPRSLIGDESYKPTKYVNIP